MNRNEFIEWFWSLPNNKALAETELGQNAQFEELAYVAFERWVKHRQHCPEFYMTLDLVKRPLFCCGAEGKADYLDIDPCCPAECPKVESGHYEV